MNIKIDDGVLSCPHCKSDYLHHTMVEIYNRREDKDWDRISVSTCDEMSGDNKYELSIDQKGINPSLRRSGIRIIFSCEQCEHLSKLVVYQHKGQTFMEWEK